MRPIPNNFVGSPYDNSGGSAGGWVGPTPDSPHIMLGGRAALPIQNSFAHSGADFIMQTVWSGSQPGRCRTCVQSVQAGRAERVGPTVWDCSGMMDTVRVPGNKTAPRPLTRHSPGPALTLVTRTSQHQLRPHRPTLRGYAAFLAFSICGFADIKLSLSCDSCIPSPGVRQAKSKEV